MHTRRNFLQFGLTAVGLCRAQQSIDCGATIAGATSYALPSSGPVPRARLRDFVNSKDWSQFVAANQRLKDCQRFSTLANWHRDCCNGTTVTDVHGSLYFLPWHRIVVHLYEKALQQASGNANLRVPYWEWQMDLGVPPEYEDAAALKPVDKQGQTIARRNVIETESWSADALNTDRFLLKSTFQDLSIESDQGAHTWVHTWSGSVMEEVKEAARDPLFFVHHANMDRLWFQWKQQNPGPCPRELADYKIYFGDLDGSPRFITIDAMWDESNLGYTYPTTSEPHMSLVLRNLRKPNRSDNSLAVTVDRANAREFLEFVDVDLHDLSSKPHEAVFFAIFLKTKHGESVPSLVARGAMPRTHSGKSTCSLIAPITDARSLHPKAKFEIARTSPRMQIIGGMKALRVRAINRLTLSSAV